MMELRWDRRARKSGEHFAGSNAVSMFNGGFAILEFREVKGVSALEPNSITYASGWEEVPISFDLPDVSEAQMKLEESNMPQDDDFSHALKPLTLRHVPESENSICFQSLTMTDCSAEQVALARTGEAKGILVDKSMINEWLLKVIETVGRASKGDG